MNRFIILLSILVLIVSLSTVAFAVPPPGSPNNIFDYKTSVEEYEAGVMLIKGNIPLDRGEIIQSCMRDNVTYINLRFNRTWMHFDSTFADITDNTYLVAQIFPFGFFDDRYQYNLDKCISLNGLPNGTNLVLDARIGGVYQDASFTDSYGPSIWRVYLTYVDKDGNELSGTSASFTEYHYDEDTGSMAYASIPIAAPSEAVAFRIHYRFQTRIYDITSDEWFFEDGVHSINFRYMINKAEYEAAISGYENDQLIGSIDDGFQHIDDVINDGYNRPLVPDIPAGSDKFDQLDDLESGLVDDAAGYLDSYYELMDSTGLSIQTLGNTFTAVKVFLESLLDIPVLKTLVSVSLVLGLSGTILGIVGNVRIRRGE